MTRIVLAEDDLDLRTLVTRALGARGHEVVAVGDAAEALEACRVHRPALLLLDVGLPGRSGLEVLADLRGQDPGERGGEQSAGNGPRVLLLSGHTADGDVDRGLAGGADGYLPKPFSLRDLVERVESLLA